MFLCPFYADAAITLYYRWKRGENLMQAHLILFLTFSIAFLVSYSLVKAMKP